MTIRQPLVAIILSSIVAARAATLPPVHDPVMARGEDGRYYIFATGMGIDVLSSNDMTDWQREQPVFDARSQTPQWAVDSVRGYHGHTWAPDISYHDGEWKLYYSCSTFGKNNSAIGLMTNKTLDPTSADFKWVDKGMVIKSHKHADNWNAIDPNLVVTPEGERYIIFGSFWDGLQLMKLADDYQTPITQPRTIARRINKKLTLEDLDNVESFEIVNGDTVEAGPNAIEAPFISYHKGYYYLFVSFDFCCRGQASTYKTVYGRSRDIEGPYVDESGKPMEKGGGTLLFGPNEDFFGIGHCAVYDIDGKWIFLSHAYDKAQDGRARLFIKELTLDENGWIEINE